MKDEIKKMNIKISELGLTKVIHAFFCGQELKKSVEELKPDIIHSHCLLSNLSSVLHLNNYKRISTVHCDYHTDFAMSYGKIKGAVKARLFSYSLKKISFNVCCSQTLHSLLKKKHPEIPFVFVNNGVDTDKFCPSDKKTLRAKLCLPQDKKIFIWVGNLIKLKNPMLMVNAVKRLAGKDYFFIFCGDGSLLEPCRKELSRYQNVLFTGRILNINEFLQASDVFVSTSTSEGLPNAALEALACGLFAILSDIEQHRLLIKENFSALFNLNDEGDLIKKMQTAAQNAAGAANFIKESFSAKKMSQEYQNYYELLRT
jgi:glycosyltransferase involved in cell wall biosynthesis